MTRSKARRVLYITWDGPQVSYLEGLFLPIFVGLKAHGIAIHVLQFTWDEEEPTPRQVEACKQADVPYERVAVTRSLGGIGAYTTARLGGRKIDELVARWSIDALMPRSLMPAIAVAHSKSGERLPCIFDADGLAADERIDFGGRSRKSLTHRMLKSYERKMITRARSVIGRTAEACAIYRSYDEKPTEHKYFVSVNGRDPDQFQPLSEAERQRARSELGLPREAPVIVHSGSFGSKYCPEIELMLVAAVQRLRRDTVFLVLTGQPDVAANFFTQYSHCLSDAPVIRRLSYDQMARALAACDLGLCLYRDTFSNKAFQPTKLGEFLLSGLPVVATPNALLPELRGLSFARRIVDASAGKLTKQPSGL